MAKIMITQDNLLSPAELEGLLSQSENRGSALDSIYRLVRQLFLFEMQFKMSSDVFYARFMRGELGDDLRFIKWAGRYELYLEAKQKIDYQLAHLPVTV